MEFGFSMLVRGPDACPENFVAIAERAELLELDSLWFSAHVILPPQTKSDYAMVPGARYGDHWKEGYWEPFTVMSYLAAKTRRITFGTSIIVLPMHNPFEVAKQIAEFDQLSDGRFIFGVGVGWFEEEFEILGQNFKDRGARTNDALELMNALWTQEPVTYEGKYYRVQDAHFGPKPLQSPRPPIWVGGGGDAALKRAARFGDYWHPVRPTYESIETAKSKLANYLEQAGRAPDSVGLGIKLPLTFHGDASGSDRYMTQGRPRDIADAIERFRDLGADHFVFDVVPEERSVAIDTMERFAQEVRPLLD